MPCTTTRSGCPAGRGSRCAAPTAPAGRSCWCTGCRPTPGCGTARRALLAAAGHQVVAVDQRGHGRSEQVADGYTTAQCAADLAALCAAARADRRARAGGRRPVLGRQRRADLAAEHGGVAAVALVDGGWIWLGQRYPTFEQCWAELAPQVPHGLTLAELGDRFREWFAGFPPEGIEAAAGQRHRGRRRARRRAAHPRAPQADPALAVGGRPAAHCSRRVTVPVLLAAAVADRGRRPARPRPGRRAAARLDHLAVRRRPPRPARPAARPDGRRPARPRRAGRGGAPREPPGGDGLRRDHADDGAGPPRGVRGLSRRPGRHARHPVRVPDEPRRAGHPHPRLLRPERRPRGRGGRWSGREDAAQAEQVAGAARPGRVGVRRARLTDVRAAAVARHARPGRSRRRRTPGRHPRPRQRRRAHAGQPRGAGLRDLQGGRRPGVGRGARTCSASSPASPRRSSRTTTTRRARPTTPGSATSARSG